MRRCSSGWMAMAMVAGLGCDGPPPAGVPRDGEGDLRRTPDGADALPPEGEPSAAPDDEADPQPSSPALVRGAGAERLPWGQDVTGAMRERQGRFAPTVAHAWRDPFRDPRRPRVVTREAGHFVLQMPDPLPVGTPTVHEGRVVVGAGLWMGSMDAHDGTVQWARNTRDISPSTAACDGDLCAWSTFSCNLTAVVASTGELKSNTVLGPMVVSAPALADGIAYAAFEDTHGSPGARFSGGIGALRLDDGHALWTRRMERDAIGAPVVGDEAIHVATWGGTLHRFSRRDGAVEASAALYAAGPPVLRDEGLVMTRLAQRDDRWVAELLQEDAASPPAEDGLVSSLSALASRPAPDGRAAVRQMFPDARPRGDWPPAVVEAWPGSQLLGVTSIGPYSNHVIQPGRPAVATGDLDVAVLGDSIVAFDGARVVWTHSLGHVVDDPRLHERRARHRGWGNYHKMSFEGLPPAVLAASATRVVAVTQFGDALVLDAASGALLQTLDLGYPVATEPALADGWIYVGTATGHLVGLDTTDPAVDGWTHYRGNARRTGHPHA